MQPISNSALDLNLKDLSLKALSSKVLNLKNLKTIKFSENPKHNTFLKVFLIFLLSYMGVFEKSQAIETKSLSEKKLETKEQETTVLTEPNKPHEFQSSSQNIEMMATSTTTVETSSYSQTQKTLFLMIAGAVVGAIYGNQRAEFRSQNGLLYSGLGAATAGVIGSFLYDDSKHLKALKEQSRALQEKIALFEKSQAPKLISEGKNLLTSTLPKDVSKLINPGEWRRYKIDYWVQDSSNPYVWFRQSEMFEVVPPEITN